MLLDALFSTTSLTVSQALSTLLTYIYPYQWYAFDATITCATVWVLLRLLRPSRQLLRTTELQGPPSESFLYGVSKRVLDADDGGAIYEAWAREYGPIYAAPSSFGSKRIVLCDPKALAHFYANETWTYVLTPFARESMAFFFGRGLMWSHGEDHRRQRKSLTPAFSVAAVRQLTSVFYDLAYKAKGAWDALIESSDGDNAIIDVQNWMNHISLDTVGLAGFSHNFGALEGKHAEVTEVFDEFGASPKQKTALNSGLFVLGHMFPFLARLPTSRTRLILKINAALEDISNVMLARTRKEREMGVIGDKEEKSIVALLIKGAGADSEYHLTQEEIMSQMKVLLFAGYETTSISMTWALLELARNPDVQTKLRKELLEHGTDPTYDQLMNNLPYLDAVVHEILRLHSPLTEFTRIAIKDDVVPLSQSIRTKSGDLVDSVTIAKGTLIAISIPSVNRSVAIWGEDAKEFRPSRWLEDSESATNGIPNKAKEIQGYRHLLTFSDGPRTCLGKNFALAEFKTVLTVLVKSFVFEMRDGVDTKVEIGRGVLPRPTLAGEEGCKMPLRVRPYVA